MGALTIMITGAAGYVGRATVAAARDAGHDVVAVVRLAGVVPDGWADDDGIELVEADLSRPESVQALDMVGVDSVIHAAASLSGNDAAQERHTLTGTRHLLQAMARAEEPPRLVLVSSVSVYSGMGLQAQSEIDETSALERNPRQRDAYCRAKLNQEQITAEGALDLGAELRIMRVGAVFGPGRLWNAHVGLRIGPAVLRLVRGGEIPLCHIAHCADALVRAAETKVPDSPDGAIEVLNVVDDDLPDRVRFLNAMARTGWPRLFVPVWWRFFDIAAQVLGWLPGCPGLLRRETLRARIFPVRYPNARLKSRLGLPPTPPFEHAFTLSVGVETPEEDA
ncbi:NAD(P)-dependent oxidoreductase [Thalassovita sp.]|uniref:NAD-dependent epimerase/dehydratase family protein n=1 Tax=Thalassovita sp. TaxID=1979401 RepID=UPI0029DE78D4|nr:NAD(P)-dependent oxidoreductase [Thalassovita sp.]